jgi:hypothetical protein
VLPDFAKGKPFFAWWSSTLSKDLNFPSRTQPPRNIVQVFFLGQDCSPFVLSLYSEEENKSDVKRYTTQTVRSLKQSLLNFCHLDIIILNCVLPWESLSVASLEQVVQQRLDATRGLDSAHTSLSFEALQTLKSATDSLSGSTPIPFYLKQVISKDDIGFQKVKLTR